MQLFRYKLSEVRARVAMPLLCDQLGISVRQEGSRWSGLCPFHAEHTPSFIVSRDEEKEWRFHCFGCAAHGDIFDLWLRRQGGDFKDAVKALYGIAGFGPVPYGWPPHAPSKGPSADGAIPTHRKTVVFPPLRPLSPASCRELAALRDLDPGAVRAARDAGLVGRRAGREAAARWSDELTAAGAEGDVWDFSDLRQVDGRPVTDLNDAVRGDGDCVRAMEPAMHFNSSLGGPLP